MAGYSVTTPTGEVFHFNNAKDFENFLRKEGLWHRGWDEEPEEDYDDNDDEIPDWYGDDPLEHIGDYDPVFGD